MQGDVRNVLSEDRVYDDRVCVGGGRVDEYRVCGMKVGCVWNEPWVRRGRNTKPTKNRKPLGSYGNLSVCSD